MQTTTELEQFVERAMGDLAAGYAGVLVSLGEKLGLYRALAEGGPATSAELAGRTGCAERYVREWLNAQAAAGYVTYHPAGQRYELLPHQATVLADADSPFYMPAAWNIPASMWFDEDQAVDAFRTGDGVPWGAHHGRLFCGVAAFFRNAYAAHLVSDWIPALDGLTERLEAGARVADIGCGYGYSTVLMAQAFPNSSFVGYDVHPESIETARRHALEAGVEQRVDFAVADARGYPDAGFDLVCFFDCLHDLGDPVGAARRAREALAANGRVMLIEPRAADRVEDNLNLVGKLYYSASTTLCCAHSLSEDVGLALGAQAGAARLREVFEEAGYGHFRKALETPFNLVLEAAP